jgi:hypothetical protein
MAVKMTIEERAADIVGNRRFALRERKVIAQKIVDFMDIPTHTSFHPRRRLSESERQLQHYQRLCYNLRCHVNAMAVLGMIQTGQIA